MHNARCASSSPCDDDRTAAGKVFHRTAAKVTRSRSPSPDLRKADWSPVNEEMPKGRKVLVDKNAPSDHWMANPSSNLKRDIKYAWKHGMPELEWKRHVPSAIPVKAMKEKRPADPQGRPLMRQYVVMHKNAPSDPWIFQASRPDEPLGEERKGRRSFPEHKNYECTTLPPPTLGDAPSSTPLPAGRTSRSSSRQRSSRRQYEEQHKNQPTDPEFSPMGVRPPGADQWQARASRSLSRESARSSRQASPGRGRHKDVPGDSGLSPLTGRRRSYFPWRTDVPKTLVPFVV